MAIPFTNPPIYPPVAPGRYAATIQHASADFADRPGGVEDVSKCRAAILGLADDTGVIMNHGRPGAREGPHAFRAALVRFGVAQPAPWTPRAERRADTRAGHHAEHTLPHILDAGDIVPGRTLEETHDRVTAATEAIIALGLLPIGIGGGHDLTFAFARAACRRSGVRAGLYVDAHLDVRAEPGSGMPFRSLVQHAGVAALGVVGLSPLVTTREHHDWFVDHGGERLDVAFSIEQAQRQIESTASRANPGPGAPAPSAFVSLDLDAIDAAQMPGVSALNPDGLTVAQVAQYAHAAGRCPLVACFDIMELNPMHDADHRSARVAAYLFLRFIAGHGERAQTNR
jgi:arginase family enzyme